jgi:Kef-type K+ transport system membrane component KefB
MEPPEGIPSLLWVMLAGALAPWMSNRLAALRLPVVALELLFGVLIGPQGLGLATMDGALPYLARFGLGMLFFLAGMEIELALLRGRPLVLGAISWLLSVMLGLVFAFIGAQLGLVTQPAVVALVLSTTALGVIAPIIRDAGLHGTPLGLYVTSCGVMGEIGPILLMSALFASTGQQTNQIALTGVFIAIAVGVCWASFWIRPPGLIGLLARSMHRSGQWPVRLCMLLLALLIWLAETFRLDLALGAFAAGLAVGLASRDSRSEVLAEKLDAIGFGVMVPVFFVTSGMRLDVMSVLDRPQAGLMVLAATLALLLARGLPAVLLVPWLGVRGAAAAGLYAATSLSLIVALTSAAVESGRMDPINATVLVSAGLLSVLLFPWLAGLLLDSNRSARADDSDRR